MIERFFRIFKKEYVRQHNFATFDEAYNKIANRIDHNNFERPHSALGYATPGERSGKN